MPVLKMIISNCSKYFKSKSMIGSATILTSAIVADSVISNEPYLSTKSIGNNFKSVGRFFRSLKIAVVNSGDYSMSLFGLDQRTSEYQTAIKKVHKRAAARILEGCLQNGGLYIKLGQGLCALNHILPDEYLETLDILHDKCLVRKDDEIDELFLDEFGKRPEEMFSEFNRTPIAAASLAQVFRAKTLDDNKEVAVKVQYLDLQDRFTSDIRTINILLYLIKTVHRDFNFTWVFETLRKNLIQELDFISEGKNSERCAQDLQHLPFVYIPEVLWDYTNKRVLTTEYIAAYKISDVSALKANGFSLNEVDTKLFQTFGEQIFHTGFVHADPHPGNVFVRKFKGQTQIVLLDHGLYETLEHNERIALCAFWKHTILQNEPKMKYYASQLGIKDDHRILAEILTQKPYNTPSIRLKATLTEEEVEYMVEQTRHRFAQIVQVIRTMPQPLLLIVRNLNTVRSIAKYHGDPINRFVLLAKIATKGTFINPNVSIWNKVCYFQAVLYFNCFLWLQILKLNLMVMYLNFLNIFKKSERLAAISEELS